MQTLMKPLKLGIVHTLQDVGLSPVQAFFFHHMVTLSDINILSYQDLLPHYNGQF